MAGAVLLLGALLLSGGAYAAFSPSSSADSSASSDQAAKGKELFLVGCAFCHGQNGEGQNDISGKLLGPSLAGVGAASVDFQMGTGRMPLAAPGQQAPAKQKAYTDEEIADIAAYVASLAPGPSIPTAKDYSTEGLTDEEKQAAIVRGGQIFLTNCTACHNFNGNGGAMPRGGYAPQIINTSEKHIYEAMLTGPQSMDTFSNGNLSPEEKRDVIAYVKSMKDEPNYGGFGLGGLGPVSEGLFAWILGLGVMVAFAVWIAAHTTRTNKKKKGAAA
ncbi:cytochrome c [Nocardioides sp.]|uniref:cytochrome bc1 complex diheme cytochrome c subunit n=1 Tax=Nocardioides sp. TaxID=35761 RepID=UPI002613D30D|nr:cytochrome c [Nocardioides sp.]